MLISNLKVALFFKNQCIVTGLAYFCQAPPTIPMYLYMCIYIVLLSLW